MASSREEPPPSKKRVALRQISKEDNPESEEEDGTGPGTFRRASDQVLAERKIVKVRRTAAPPLSAPNPFSAIRLVPPPPAAAPQESVAVPPTVSPDASPFEPAVRDGIIEQPATGALVAGAAPLDTETGKEVVTADVAGQENIEPRKVEEAEDNSLSVHPKDQDVVLDDAVEKKSESVDQATAASNTTQALSSRNEEVKSRSNDPVGSSGGSSLTFEQLSSAKNAFAGSFGSGFSSSPSTVNSSLSHVSSGFVFGQPFVFGSQNFGSSMSFGLSQSQSSFAPNPGSQGVFPSVSSVFGASNGNGTPAFGSFGSPIAAHKPTTVSLQEVQVETGEEKEKSIFTADASLFEFLDGGWKERGKGELRLNISEEKDIKPRLVMRSRGNYRLLLNASLFPDMKLSKMDNRGITFACANSAVEGKTGLTTYAVKLKDGLVASEFTATVEAHKGIANSTSTEPRTPESSPKATERPSKAAETRNIEA